MPHSDLQFTPFHRIVAASVGAILTSLFVTPLDVIKTRLQIQAEDFHSSSLANNIRKYGGSSSNPNINSANLTDTITNMAKSSVSNDLCTNNPSTCPACIRFCVLDNGLMEHKVDLKKLSPFCRKMRFNNSFDAFKKIVMNEGITHLYTGLSVTLWMAVPATVLYFSAYDILRNNMLTKFGEGNNALSNTIPALCGASARIFAATVISPLELLRTQFQAKTIDRNISLINAIKLNIGESGKILSLWKGLVPTLWRDVPFSSIYWTGYEYFKDLFNDNNNNNNNNNNNSTFVTFRRAFLSGALSGSIATILTQPFDVVKTRRQRILLEDVNNSSLNNSNSNISSPNKVVTTASGQILKKRSTVLMTVIYDIMEKEGFKGLYSGIIPRITKVPLACAIMISTYEGGKLILAHYSQNQKLNK